MGNPGVMPWVSHFYIYTLDRSEAIPFPLAYFVLKHSFQIFSDYSCLFPAVSAPARLVSATLPPHRFRVVRACLWWICGQAQKLHRSKQSKREAAVRTTSRDPVHFTHSVNELFHVIDIFIRRVFRVNARTVQNDDLNAIRTKGFQCTRKAACFPDSLAAICKTTLFVKNLCNHENRFIAHDMSPHYNS